jgi:hypothetical protein
MMNFIPASRAETPPILDAAYQQAQIAAQLRQAEMAKKQMLGQAGVQFASMVPEGAWGNLGNALIGKAGNVVTPAITDAATGAVASSAPVAANSAAALTGAEAAAAGTAAAPGVGGALAALGPLGWAALLAGGLLARESF